MLAAALASLLVMSAPQQAVSTPVQDPTGRVVDLEDIVVEGRSVENLTRDFVGEVAAPARNRGLARWRNGVCIGVANLKGEAAQYIVDRVSTVAEDLGLRAGNPGCEPNVLIIATTDSNTFTEQFVDRRPRLFRVGGSGMDLGRSAFNRFITVERPVRWWNVSLPVDDNTGIGAFRIPGDINAQGAPAAPTQNVIASRLSSQIVDDAKRSFIIVDVDKIADVSITQLADYITFVALAQVDPDGDTSGYATILNVFDDPGQTQTLTNWDMAYLQGLYQTTRTRANTRSQRGEVVSAIVRAHNELTAEDKE